MWQVCPLCNGFGIDPTVNFEDELPVCAVCNGKKIISESTGLPPEFNHYDSTLKADLKPIYKGCNNIGCECNGSCAEIIGYK